MTIVFTTLWRAIGVLLTLLHLGQVGMGTVFWANGDPQNPVNYAACLHRTLKDSDMVVAHQTLPCNSRVMVIDPRTNAYAIARVGDRGPVHAIVDLSRAVAKAIGHDGHELVVLIPLK